MKKPFAFRTISAMGGGALLAIALLPGSSVAAPSTDAKAIVKSMADYLAKQTDLHFAYDTDLDVVTDDLQKVTFASSGDTTISRPNKVRLSRHGGFTDFDLISDGKTVTVNGNKAGAYATIDAPTSLADLVQKLDDLGIKSPAADLLGPDAYDQLVDSDADGKVIGTGFIDGKECTHVAFRSSTVDWQLWVQTGDQPVPCQYIITTKHVAQAPQYSIRFSGWSTGVAPAADTFSFKPAADSKQVKLDELSGIDELPDLAVEGDNP